MINQKTVDSEIYKIFQADIEKEILKGEITRAKFLSIIFLIITFFSFQFFLHEKKILFL